MLKNYNDEQSYDSWDENNNYETFSYPNQVLKTPKAPKFPKLCIRRSYDSENDLSLDLSFAQDENHACQEDANLKDREDSSDEENNNDAPCSNICIDSPKEKDHYHQFWKNCLKKDSQLVRDNKMPRAYTYVKAECLGPKFLASS